MLVVYGLIRAGEASRWTSPVVLASLCVGVAVLALFAWLEARSRRPALDPGWFRHPAFSSGVAAMTLVSFSLFGIMLFGAYYLQFERGYSPLRSGTSLLPLAVAIGVFAPLSAGLVDRFGRKTVCATGLGLVGSPWAGSGSSRPGHRRCGWSRCCSCSASGMGLAMAPATTAILQSLPPARAGAGSAVNSTVGRVGGALGVAVLGPVLATAYRSAMGDALAGLPPAAGESVGATRGLVERHPTLLPDHSAGLLQAASSAFIHATHVTAAVSAGAMTVAVVIVLVFMPNRST